MEHFAQVMKSFVPHFWQKRTEGSVIFALHFGHPGVWLPWPTACSFLSTPPITLFCTLELSVETARLSMLSIKPMK